MNMNSLLSVALQMTEGETIRYSDLQTKKERRKSSFTKNDLFLTLRAKECKARGE
ncbi:hypothetical protein PsalN5692_01905 [Piscirickettsia salmonis]|uniref:hypothetical protein n=1 Tax=Piscirickettsia salmonis TaxID=1238 RepID=UPI0018ACAC6D|nr:hypothetical protein [Piscirickettsia salmonis]QGP50440.1 hypothetical protein PsalN5692_01905 [Piscirickettsia salmonis]